MTIFLSENIKRLRHEREITQETLADFLGVTFQSVSKWERGESYPDITMLPAIASFFNISVDSLLGVDKAQKENKIREYFEIYDTMKLKDLSLTFDKFKKAVKEFPGDFRILIRYMELLQEEKDSVLDSEYEKSSKELVAIYENIQNHCTDDSIRIRSKRIMISHLIRKYDCICNEEGKYRVYKKYLHQAEEIANTLPALCDSKEMLLMGLAYDTETFYATHRNALEELLFLFGETSFGYCYDYTPEKRIEIFAHIQGLLNVIFPDGSYGKNCFHRLYNYGHLGHLYHQIGDDVKALKYLKIAAEYAKELDKAPDVSERAARFYNYGPIFRETNASQFMKIVMTEHYPLSDDFKSTAEFKEIIAMLE